VSGVEEVAFVIFLIGHVFFFAWVAVLTIRK
jgi:hypothetical protein